MSFFAQCLLLIITLLPMFASAAPQEIIIIRHADKLNQDESGPALSARGMVRSIKFAYYFLEKFGEPDFIVAADDQKANGREIAIRSIQTVAPLANMLQIEHPDADFPIIHPYPSDSYEQLANDLLENAKFNRKLILICWSHQRIAKLAKALGVTDPISSWPKYDYDTVYDIKFDSSGRIRTFKELKKQFPVDFEDSWPALRAKLF